MRYRKDIDGLRAIAVVAVMFFHFRMGFPGGYAGVDVFFVISGFLIGTVVIAKVEKGEFSVGTFWIRRVRRLLAALFLMVVGVAVAGWLWMVPAHLEEIGKSILAQPALAANIYFFQESGYFETASEYQPLLHTWSLAVEEQFYLLFPFILPFFLRFGRKVSIYVSIGIALLSLAWSIYGSISYQSFTFYLIPSRIWELNLGVILALLVTGRRAFAVGRGLREVFSWLGLAMILAAFFFFGIETSFPGYLALLPCLGTAFLLFSNQVSSPGELTSAGRLLSGRLPVFIGKISYSLYLWHWPILVFYSYLKLSDLTPADRALCFVVSFVPAVLSWKFVEQPIRKQRILKSTGNLIGAAVAAVLVMVAVGLWFSKSHGLPARFADKVLQAAVDPPEKPYFKTRARNFFRKHGELPTVGADAKTAKKHILLWGDSHAVALLPLLDRLGSENNVCVHVAGEPSTPPLLDAYTERIGKGAILWGRRVIQFAEENNITEVILHARWRVYLEGTPDGDMRNLVSDRDTHSHSPEMAGVVFEKVLKNTLEQLLEKGFKVSVLDDVPFQPRSVPETVILAVSRNVDPNSLGPLVREQRKLTEGIDSLFESVLSGKAVMRMDPDPLLLNEKGDRYSLTRDGRILYVDQHHLSSNGTKQLRGLLLPLFDESK